MNSQLIDLSPDEHPVLSPSPPLTSGTCTPHHGRSPSQNVTEAQIRRQQRHSKKLSVSFPILVPTKGNETPKSQHRISPMALSNKPAAFFSPPSSQQSHCAMVSSAAMLGPLTPPSEEDPLQTSRRAQSRARFHMGQGFTSSQFLTLLASQERKVLELKEELGRAEIELTALKKQWAVYEAGKKKGELRGQPVQMRSVTQHSRSKSVVESSAGLGLAGIEMPAHDMVLDAERENRKDIVRERMMARGASLDNGRDTHSGPKKNGQRVFSSSKHTRTLSLLTTAAVTRNDRTGSLSSATNTKFSLDLVRTPSLDTPSTNTTPSVVSLSRSNSGLEALNFGKTYKDLASVAGRKNLPQGLSPEQFVKQGKQMVDGVRDGLWNFFEDIRQATVGEEAITGVNTGPRRQHSTKHLSHAGHSKLKRTMTDGSDKPRAARKTATKENETSFWKEFGIDTPKSDKIKQQDSGINGNVHGHRDSRPSLPGRWPSTKSSGSFGPRCSKHDLIHEYEDDGNGRVEEVSVTGSDIEPSKRTGASGGQEHHESKSSTDSRHPPSLVSDLLDEEDESWDNWDSTSSFDPTSPHFMERRESRQRCRQEGGIRGQREGKDVHWHDLLS